MKIKLIKFFLSIILIIAFYTITFAGVNKKENAKILVLHSYHKGLSWTENVVSGIEKILLNAEDKKVSIDFEYMDTKRFFSEKYLRILKNIYTYKFKKIKYDLIIAVDDNALNFLYKNRDSIFPGTPVVFCGINFLDIEKQKNLKNYTGVIEAFDVKATLDIALKLHPDTKEFVFVGDSSNTSLKNIQAIKLFESHYYNRGVKFSFFQDADIMKYQMDLESISSHSIVIALLFNRDSDGKFYSYQDSFKIYTLNVNRPIYTFWSFYLGHGAVGGKIISGKAQGESAAKIALSILRGKPIYDIPVIMESPNRYVFDYKFLKKYNIDRAKLPRGSEIINDTIGFYEFYQNNKLLFNSIIAFIFFLVIVILILIINIIKRKRYEKELAVINKSYRRFVPYEFIEKIKRDQILDVNLGDKIEIYATLLFCDIRSFTSISEKMTPSENFEFINSYLKVISPAIRDHGGFIIKYIGDAILAVFIDHTEKAISAAIEMQRRVFLFNKNSKYNFDIKIGVGLSYDRILLGTIGDDNRMDGAVISNSVDLVNQLEAMTKEFDAQVIADESVMKNLKKYKDLFLVRRIYDINKKCSLYEILDGNVSKVVELKLKTLKFFEKGLLFFLKKDYSSSSKYFSNVLKINSEDKAARFFMNKMKSNLKDE